MDDNELKKILQAVSATETGQFEQHRYKTPDCPPLTRFRDLVFQPTVQTPQEKAHMVGCRYCQMTLRMCEEAINDPSLGVAPEKKRTENIAASRNQLLEGEQSVGPLRDGPEKMTNVERSRPWLRVIPGGKKQPIGVQEPARLQDDRAEIRVAAQQQTESGWPREIEVHVHGVSSPVRLEFDEFGFGLVVQCMGPPELSEVLLWLDKANKEIPLVVGSKAIVGPLEDFDLTHESSKEDIINALISLGIPIARGTK